MMVGLDDSFSGLGARLINKPRRFVASYLGRVSANRKRGSESVKKVKKFGFCLEA